MAKLSVIEARKAAALESILADIKLIKAALGIDEVDPNPPEAPAAPEDPTPPAEKPAE